MREREKRKRKTKQNKTCHLPRIPVRRKEKSLLQEVEILNLCNVQMYQVLNLCCRTGTPPNSRYTGFPGEK